MDMAERVAEESTCIAAQVGAVLVKDERIISIGYNGTPKGFDNCLTVFRNGGFTRDEHHDWSNQHEIHAEMNTILYAAKYGIPTNGCILYVTHEPCDNCLKNCIAAAISKIIYKHPYRNDELATEYRDNRLITLEQYKEK